MGTDTIQERARNAPERRRFHRQTTPPAGLHRSGAEDDEVLVDENAPPRSTYEAGALAFHGGVIKIEARSSFRSARLAFRQPYQAVASNDRAARCHFDVAQRRQLGQCDCRYFPGSRPKANFKGYFEQRDKLFRQ
jgi:hypothetical protein